MVVNLASTGSNARCYIVNGGGQNVPDWLLKRDRKRRSKGEAGQGISLLQDFEFPEASNKIKTTKDGQYCLVTGTYKPRLKIYDLPELSLKSERVTDAENVDFCILSDDWTKTLHLQTDRSVSVHTASKVFYSTRIPTHGRALAYHFPSCDALIGAAGNQVYRLNLEQGRFLNSLECTSSVTGVNALDINPAHGLLACGTENEDSAGTVEFWDLRQRRRAGVLNLPHEQLLGATSFAGDTFASPLSVTALASRLDGLNVAVGTSTGHTLLYDIRSSSAYTVKDQGYGLPVKKVEWCYGLGSEDSNEAAGLVASVDSKVLKIWGSNSGSNLISINPASDINDLHIYPDSGLVMLANEGSPVTAYYIPSLGQAPKWCRFLDNMTEEMEEDTNTTLYDDFKFVDRAELRQLGMEHLIGTNTLKPYMHGFFVDLRLYTKARAIANPFEYAEYRDRLVREKLEKERESRIRASKNVMSKKQKEAQAAVESARVNKDLAEKIMQRDEKEERARQRKAARKGQDMEPSRTDASAPSVLTDSRFGALFEDPEFEVDPDSLEFAMLNPSTVAQKNERPRDRQQIDEDAEEVDDDDRADGNASEDDEQDDRASDGSDSSDEGDLGQYDPRTKNNRAAPGQLDVRTGKRKAPSQIREKEAKREAWQAKKAERQARPRLVVGDDDRSASMSGHSERTFGQRAYSSMLAGGRSSRSGREVPRGSGESLEGSIRPTAGGGMEYSFVPKTTSADDAKEEARLRKKAKMDKQASENIKSGRFGAGLEASSGSAENARAHLALAEDDRSGRKGMRRVYRSASRNKTRNL